MSSLRQTNSWFFRYKLYHIPFWFLYHYLWWSLITGSLVAPANSLIHTPYAIKFSFYIIFQAAGVYFNLYFLLPRFLEKGKYVTYVTLVILTIVSVATLIAPGYYLSTYISGTTFQELFGFQPESIFFVIKQNTLASSAASMTLAMSIKLTKNWIESTRMQRELEKEKLETELKFLRAQFNPHFLFNTINSIFFLIHKNPVKASDALAKFSDLLRYQLYECNEKQIPLAHEITYLENFVELQKLRQNKNVEVVLDVDQQSGRNLMIAPFLLITFTENAFKHLSDHADRPNWIRAILRVNGLQLHFKIINSVKDQKEQNLVDYGGLGLKNITRRLDLIYPDQHELDIRHDASSFEVNLSLKLTEIFEAPSIPKSA